jgi:predicted permease
VDPGFDPSNTLLVRIDPTLNGYDEQRVRDFYASALERLGAIPGVRSASFSSHTLISGSAAISEALPPGLAAPDPGSAGATRFSESHRAWLLTVDDSFLNTMGIRLIKGRTFTPGDSKLSQRVAIVNQSLARQLFGETDPIGRQFKLGLDPTSPLTEVIGLCADAKFSSIRRDAPPTAYRSYRQQPIGRMTFALKTTGDPASIVTSAREAIRQLDPNLPVSDFRSQADQIRGSLRRERLVATLATLLGAITILLSSIGLYALLAYSVTRRTREIGVRMALGADRATVRWQVLKQSLVLAGLGLAVGVPSALAGTGLLDALLYGLTARDPRALAAAALIMLTVSVAAAYVPARRASRVDPIVALREE